MNEGMQGKTWSNFDAKSFASTYAENVQSSGVNAYRQESRGANFYTQESDRPYPTLSQYTVVGINVSKIPDVQNAIKSYVTKIQEDLAELNVVADKANAFKSANNSVETAVTTFMTNVQEDCHNLTSQLLAFYDKLTDVTRAYEAATGSLADNITTSANNMAKGTEYVEGKI